MALRADVALAVELIPEPLVDDPPHLRHAPLHDVAEVLIVDVEVLPTDRALRALLQLVLPISSQIVRSAITPRIN